VPPNITIYKSSLAVALKVHNTVLEFESEPNEKYFSDRLANHERLVLVAHVDDKPAGYLIGYDRDQDGSFYCWMTGVNPVYRRMGIVRCLMKYEETWAKARGYTSIKVKTNNERRAMLINLITSGFNVVSVDPIAPPRYLSVHLEKQLA
jgi:ribosomal protein S18 acetylase RimI-like enzyme